MTNISGIKSVSSSIKYWMCHVKKQINAMLLNMNIYTLVDPFVSQFNTTNIYNGFHVIHFYDIQKRTDKNIFILPFRMISEYFARLRKN